MTIQIVYRSISAPHPRRGCLPCCFLRLRSGCASGLAEERAEVVGVDDLAPAPDEIAECEDGPSRVGRVKRVQPGLRVIMMTRRTALRDRVRGYDAGADIYLPKPVDEDELLAAVRALSHQLRLEAVKTSDDGADVLQLDARGMRLVGLNVAPLAWAEVVLLSGLCRAPGQRLEHWQLLELLGLDLARSRPRPFHLRSE
jgi:CheY-like chemotaxis protein